MTIISKLRQYFTIENIAVVALCVISVFSSSSKMTDTNIIPKQLFTALCLWFSALLLSLKVLAGRKLRITPFAWATIITSICVLESLIAILQFCIYTLLGLKLLISGTYDNPVGLMTTLCLGLPFSFYCYSDSNKHKTMAFISIVLIIIGILLSQSRTGIIACALTITIFILRHYKFSNIRIILILGALSAVAALALYYVNTLSADGRLLIWRACWPLIVATPFWGYGAGAFNRLYMNAQAAYLQNFPSDSNYAMLAGNPTVPFNEYINLYLSFGGIGIIMSGIYICVLIYAYKIKKDHTKRISMLTLAILGFISIFSYPLTYSFSWIIIILCSIILLSSFNFRLSKLFKKFSCIIMVLGSIYLAYFTTERIDAEMQWESARQRRDLTSYSQLQNKLGHIPHFLYNYAFEALHQQQYDQCLSLANKCSSLLSHYDLEILLGDTYLKKQDYESAEKHYYNAHAMIPCRFIPLLGLYDTYIAAGDSEKALDIAYDIIDKPVKIESQTVKQIKYRIKKAISQDITK